MLTEYIQIFVLTEYIETVVLQDIVELKRQELATKDQQNSTRLQKRHELMQKRAEDQRKYVTILLYNLSLNGGETGRGTESLTHKNGCYVMGKHEYWSLVDANLEYLLFFTSFLFIVRGLALLS